MAHDPHVQEAAGLSVSVTEDGYILIEDEYEVLHYLTTSVVDELCAALQSCKAHALKIDMKH